MMAACDYARSDALCYPGLYDKVTNLSFNAHQVTSLDSELFGMARMNPQRIGVCDLVKPFRVGASRVDLYGQAECRDQNRLILVQLFRVYMALDIGRNGNIAPSPICQRF